MPKNIIEAYFDEFNMIDFVIDSYNQLLDNIGNTIQKYNFFRNFKDSKKQDIRLQFKCKDVSFSLKDLRTMVEATRQRSKPFYIHCDIQLEVLFKKITDGKESPPISYNINEFYVDLPLLTNCKYDPILQQSVRQRWDLGQDIDQVGGDMIFNGVPYVVQNKYSYPYNKAIVAKADKNDAIIMANFLYQSDVMFGNSYYSVYTLIKLKGQDKETVFDLVMDFKQTQDKRVKKARIPIFLLFKAFGILTDRQAIQFCNSTNDPNLTYFLINILRDGPVTNQVMPRSDLTQVQAKKMLIKLIQNNGSEEEVESAIEQYIYPFDQGEQYAYTLGEIVRQIYSAYTEGKYSNRDSLHNKRLQMIGQQVHRGLLKSLQESFGQAMYSIQNEISKYDFADFKNNQKIDSLLKDTIQQMSENCSRILTKSFVNSNSDQEVVAPLQKTLNEQKTILLDIQQKRQIVIRAESMGGRVTWLQRKLQQDFYGFICPVSTPEGGASTGRYASPSIYAYVSQITDPSEIIDFVRDSKYYSDKYLKNSMPIRVNYNTIGFVKFEDFKKLYNELMQFRRDNAFTKDYQTTQKYDLKFYKKYTIAKKADQLFTSIYYDIENPQIGIWTDSGRIMVPIVDCQYDGKSTLTQLIEKGHLQFICPDMADNFIIKEWAQAKSDEWRFLPQSILGEFPACSPFSGNQKAIRALYSSAQMKQNISVPYTNPMCMMTNQQLVLNQQQTNPIDTTFARLMFGSKPVFQIVFLVIKPDTYNQEDAIVTNLGYFYRNGASTSSYKSFVQQLEENEKFAYPDTKNKKYNYSLLDQKTAQPSEIGLTVKYNDVLANKQKEDPLSKETKNTPLVYDLPYPAKYTTISSLNTNLKNERLIQTQLTRYPAEGDKFVSRNAQKGTIGIMLPEYLTDILDSGICPTFVGNPAGILKRETYGQIMEPAMSYYLATKGIYTAEWGHDEYSQELLQEVSKQGQLDGYSKYGNKLNMGFIGGPMCYAAQKHLVAQKVYAVNIAAKNKITRQPAQGRKRHGGMRIGNTEQSAFYAQGTANVIRDLAGKNSSDTLWFICKKCGQNHVYRLEKEYQSNTDETFNYCCPKCGYLKDDEVQVQGFSYQQTMLQQILDSLGIQIEYSAK